MDSTPDIRLNIALRLLGVPLGFALGDSLRRGAIFDRIFLTYTYMDKIHMLMDNPVYYMVYWRSVSESTTCGVKKWVEEVLSFTCGAFGGSE